MSTFNFGGRGSSPTKLRLVTCHYLGMLSCVQGLADTVPLKFEKAKNV